MIRQNIKHFRRFFLSYTNVTKYELKAIFSKAKEIKIIAHLTGSYGHFRASKIQHSVPQTEMYCCQILSSVQSDYIESYA